MNTKINQFLEEVKKAMNTQALIKLSFGDYHGKVAELKKVYVKPVLIKRKEQFSFVYRYQRKDITKNYLAEEAIAEMRSLLGEEAFRHARLCTLEFDLSIQYGKGKFLVRKLPPTEKELPNKSHDKQKKRKIAAKGKHYLHALKITDVDGKVYKATQDKYRQINHYIEILDALLKDLPKQEMLKVVDMGAGKGYLTFALYDYLNNQLKMPATVIGVEYREDLVTLCNQIAKDSAFTNLRFQQGSIEDYEAGEELNVLIALHACDTATDDAIYKGITNEADLIVVAPCCHKQIRKAIEKSKAKNNLDFLLKHGIFMERQAEMVTDGLRALILEYYGYSTKVFEFISDAHTPKNVLIVGTKKKVAAAKQSKILAKIQATKAYFGIDFHYLEQLVGLNH